MSDARSKVSLVAPIIAALEMEPRPAGQIAEAVDVGAEPADDDRGSGIDGRGG